MMRPDEKTGPAAADGQRPLPGQIVLVMQGGGAPGCYQAGVYQALHESGIEPDWVIGTSIGAINGAIIAGNPIADRLERLRAFWSGIGSWSGGRWGSLTTVLAGVPGFFWPNPAVAWGMETAVGVERASLYSIDPLKKMLPRLVDFGLINSGSPRLTVGLVGVRSGAMKYFDSRDEVIGLDHVLGSSAIPPSFPAVRVGGEAYWDGGIYSNTPVEVVFDDNPRRSSIIFAAQIWHSRGPEPESLADVFMRQKDILFGSRARSHVARQAQLHRMRHVVRELVKMLPNDRRGTPEVQGARRLRLRDGDEFDRDQCAAHRRRKQHAGLRFFPGNHSGPLAGRLRRCQAHDHAAPVGKPGRSDDRRCGVFVRRR